MNTASQQDQRMNKAAGPAGNLYTQEVMDAMTTEQLLMEYKATGCEELKWPVVLRYTGLIRSIALQIRGVYSSFTQVEDIVNEGVIALVQAVEKFDPEKGKFETYVVKRIRGMIIDLARRQDWAPRSVRRRAKEIDQVVTELYTSLGRFPTDAEMAQRMGITEGQYQEALVNTSMCNVMSLEAIFDEQEQWFVGANGEGNTEPLPEQALLADELESILAKGIASLRENEQMVLSLYYHQNLNMKDIAQVLGVSEPRISQIHAKAIQKLRLYMGSYMKSGA